MGDNRLQKILLDLYEKLFIFYGKQYWWPANSSFEVIVGAILTQNTSWSNVEKAILSLKKADLLTPKAILAADCAQLANIIKSSGYYNIKSIRLKSISSLIEANGGGDNFPIFLKKDASELRFLLLQVKGIGFETADTIVLYAANKISFVIDTYTRRILSRHNIISGEESYEALRAMFMNNIPADPYLYNEYHALIVAVAKDYCKRSKPNCGNCPLAGFNQL